MFKKICVRKQDIYILKLLSQQDKEKLIKRANKIVSELKKSDKFRKKYNRNFSNQKEGKKIYYFYSSTSSNNQNDDIKYLPSICFTTPTIKADNNIKLVLNGENSERIKHFNDYFLINKTKNEQNSLIINENKSITVKDINSPLRNHFFKENPKKHREGNLYSEILDIDNKNKNLVNNNIINEDSEKTEKKYNKFPIKNLKHRDFLKDHNEIISNIGDNKDDIAATIYRKKYTKDVGTNYCPEKTIKKHTVINFQYRNNKMKHNNYHTLNSLNTLNDIITEKKFLSESKRYKTKPSLKLNNNFFQNVNIKSLKNYLNNNNNYKTHNKTNISNISNNTNINNVSSIDEDKSPPQLMISKIDKERQKNLAKTNIKERERERKIEKDQRKEYNEDSNKYLNQSHMINKSQKILKRNNNNMNINQIYNMINDLNKKRSFSILNNNNEKNSKMAILNIKNGNINKILNQVPNVVKRFYGIIDTNNTNNNINNSNYINNYEN